MERKRGEKVVALASVGVLAMGTTSCKAEGPVRGAAIDISVASHHACRIKPGGSIDCWGEDEFATLEPPAGKFVEVDTSRDRGCARREDGPVACWGRGYDGVGHLEGPFETISVGEPESCGLGRDGRLVCWEGTETEERPGAFTAVSAAEYYACAIDRQKRIDCWKTGSHGRAQGHPEASMEHLNRAVGSEEGFIAVATGFGTTCGLSEAGALHCHGPVRDVPEGDFVDLGVGGEMVCAVESEGGFECSKRPMPDHVYMEAKPGAKTLEEVLSDSRDDLAEKYGPFDRVVVGGQIRCLLDGDERFMCVGAKAGGESAPRPGWF